MAQQWVVTHGRSFLSCLCLRKPRRGRSAGLLHTTFEWTEDAAMALHFDKAAAKMFAGIANNIGGGSSHGVAPYVPAAASPPSAPKKP